MDNIEQEYDILKKKKEKAYEQYQKQVNAFLKIKQKRDTKQYFEQYVGRCFFAYYSKYDEYNYIKVTDVKPHGLLGIIWVQCTDNYGQIRYNDTISVDDLRKKYLEVAEKDFEQKVKKILGIMENKTLKQGETKQ